MANRRANRDNDNQPLVCHPGDGAVMHIKGVPVGVVVLEDVLLFAVHGNYGSYGGRVDLTMDAEHPCAIEMYGSTDQTT